jgi:hypothetical protein
VKTAYVHGLGLWTPGHAGAAAWCSGEPDAGATAPAAALLAGPLRRRASALTRMAVEALEQAAGEAGCDLSRLASVWATAHGEHETAVEILAMMHRGEGKLSPTRFHNSVYNTASGYASIASGNRAVSTTVSGGAELVSTALLESLCLLEAGAEEVALVLADEPLLPPFDPNRARAPLALSFCLSSRRAGARAALSGLRRDAIAPVKRHERFGGLYVAAALPLLERVALGRPGTVALELEADAEGGGRVWCIDVERAGRSGE